jgi:transcriptional regulator with XRE-family HTH domain
MFENRIQKLRKRAKLTRAELADHARIGVAEMKRIELGIQPAHLDAADRICDGLDSTLSELFPAAEPILTRIGDPFQTYNLNDRTIERLAKAGLDTDPARVSLKVQLRGKNALDFVLSGPERRRVWTVLEDAAKPFVVFDAGLDRVALAVPHVLGWSFTTPARYEDAGSAGLSIYLTDRKEPLVFDVNPDTASIFDDAEEPTAQLQDVFFHLDSGDLPFINFVDEVETEVFVRTREIALVLAPLDLVEPSMRMDGED